MTSILEQWKSESYWQSLCPELSAKKSISSTPPLSNNASPRLLQDGYTPAPGFLDLSDARALNTAITQLKAAGEFPVWIAIYDAFWELMQAVAAPVSALLQTEVLALPDFWAWHLDMADSGWAPHRDKNESTIRPDGLPNSLTAWVALSEVTADSGCIYMVPAPDDPYYPDLAIQQIDKWQAVRALPAKPGDLLCWNQNVLHWGGTRSQWSPEPRVSVAFEFQRADIEPYNTPLLNPKERPDINTRRRLIAKQLLQYTHMYNIAQDVQDAAKSLVS